MASITGLIKHLRQGVAADKLARRLGGLPQHERVHWFGARSRADAARALARHGLYALAQQPVAAAWVAVVGEDSALRRAVARQLDQLSLTYRCLTEQQALTELDDGDIGALRLILCGFDQSRDIARLGAALIEHPRLSRVPFEYAPGLDPERKLFARLDQYRDTFFIAPALVDEIPVYSIYEESLKHFEQKCGLRDYLDLYQLLRQVHGSGVPGDICEFGSFRGHSGWLIARLLKALGSDKKLYMFDTFEKFPRETYGVDDFWSATHEVDFETVKARMAALDNVVMVKGDFTRTLETKGPATIAMAYVDCDSYRATRYLVEAIWLSRLPRGGLMVFEDYGHLALLGNRLAVETSVRQPRLGFQFYSQFSGFYIALKTD